MGDIENPWHSRPIDVHRWSDHPEVAGLKTAQNQPKAETGALSKFAGKAIP